MNLKIRVGGVPEHFNLPWHLAFENGHFLKKHLDLEWMTYHGGTGQMCKALRNEEVDVCVILTEGIISDIIKGNPSKIIGHYINTPLIWGIHTGSKNKLESIDQIFDERYAISRFGSGSHLMAIVDANSKGFTIDQEQFRIINDLVGAINSLTELKTDVFYWEKYMTKPFVDSGQLRRLGEFHTPWPSFVIAARTSFIDKYPGELGDMLTIIRFHCEQFMRSSRSIDLVSTRFNLKIEDVEQWFYLTEWSTDNIISSKMIENVLFALTKAGIVDQKHAKTHII